jgi:hypothetical protein
MRRPRALLLAALLALALGCGPRVIRETVYESEGVTVQLRHTLEDGKKVALGYDQPLTIADVRVAHILGSLTYQPAKAGPKPVIRTQHLYDLAEGIAKALGKAGPDDLVVAWSLSHDRRLVVFSDMRVTSMQVHARDDQLYLGFYDIDQRVERDQARVDLEPPADFPTSDPDFTLRVDDQARVDLEPPADFPTSDPDFTLRVDRAQARIGKRTLVIDWRDDYYRRPVAFQSRSRGLSRRTIIMQEDPLDEGIESEAPEPAPAREVSPEREVSPPTTDAQLRALDQLDGARRAGLVTESEFQRRRRLILQGRLEEAGYPPGPE